MSNSRGIIKIHNKRLIMLTIKHELLYGDIWNNEREEIAEVLERFPNGHFLILLQSMKGKMKY